MSLVQIPLREITESRLRASGKWWLAHGNYQGQEAWSCRQAITVRDRLGSGEHGGIPLWTELKSEVGIVFDPNSKRSRPYAAHCRANTRIVRGKLARALGLPSDAHFETALEESSGDDAHALGEEAADAANPRKSRSEYFGLVNPFNLDLILRGLELTFEVEDIIQIFDDSLLLFGGRPDTVTTNLGDREVAFEIRPRDLIDAVTEIFPQTRVSEVAEPCPIWLGVDGRYQKQENLRFPPPSGPKIGIITGNSPESGLTLWRETLAIFRGIYRNTADVLMPAVMVHSLPAMGLSMELDDRKDFMWPDLEAAVVKLLEARCEIITLACNTTIYFEPQIRPLCERYGARFVSIAEACIPATLEALAKTGSPQKKVGLVGIGAVIDFEGDLSGYSAHFKAAGIDVEPCSGLELAYLMKSIGIDHAETTRAVRDFRRLMNAHLPGVEVVVMALTEISLVYRKHIQKLPKKYKPKKAFVDPLAELARYLVSLYLQQGFSDSPVCQLLNEGKFRDDLTRLVAGSSGAELT